MDAPQEHAIALGLRSGHTDAWQALYDAYAQPVWHAVARQMPSDPTGVADVVQEIFLAAARAARQFDPQRGTLWMWLCGIARQQVALHFRIRQRHDRWQGDGAAEGDAGRQLLEWLGRRHAEPSQQAAAAAVAAIVRSTLTRLPEEYESLLAARYFDGISVDELAGQQQSTVTAVRSKLARARRAFKEALSQSVNART